ncbi:SURF1 family protein [Longimicrobium sp.]|uniref:SURF1 family protein n=1 Tax=Longimicrobium sp. TaxID=2029185 RepID=UPI002BF74F8F|nr:SURF1 family protein [Longimicrobium sp.]HSU16870.1 SURF1 family protein [Longimicrobium sp.]
MRVTLRGVLAAAFVLGMCALCVRLGFWQLDRLQQRKARNHAVEVALRMPTLDFDSLTAAAVERQPELFINRKVRVTGTYDPAGDIVLRGRSSDGNPGVHIVTPILVPHVPQALLVNRGWVPSPDAATVDARPYAEPGERTIVGLFMEVPRNTQAGGQPAETTVGGKRVTTYRRLDLDVLRRRSPRPVLPLYVQQLPDSGAAGRPPVRVPTPPLDNGPHLSYAVQWFSFAAIGIIGLIVVWVRQRRAARGPG